MFNHGDQFNPIPTFWRQRSRIPGRARPALAKFRRAGNAHLQSRVIGVRPVLVSFATNFCMASAPITPLPPSLGFSYTPSSIVAVGPPFIQVNGYTTVGDPITGPRNRYENAFDYSGSLSWVHGRHELKFGGRIPASPDQCPARHRHQRLLRLRSFPGRAECVRQFLVRPAHLFLQGRGDFSRGIRGNGLNGYAQDTYRVKQRLTLNLGLRYELPFPYTEIQNRQTLYIPGRQSTVLPDAPAGLLYPGDAGVPAGLIPDIQERLRSARRLRLGSHRQRQVAGHFGLRYLLGAVLHRPGRPAAIAHQRATVPADGAGQRSDFGNPSRPSFQRQSASSGRVRNSLHQPHLDSKLPLPYAQD